MKNASIKTLFVLLGVFNLNTFSYAQDDSYNKALDYIKSHRSECTIGDGYGCAAVDESSVVMNQSLMVPAVYLEIWPVVYLDFNAIQTLSVEQKKATHYKIGFAEDAQSYIVIFRALLLPEIDKAGEVTGISRSSFGQSVRYEVDKKTRQIISRKFYK